MSAIWPFITNRAKSVSDKIFGRISLDLANFSTDEVSFSSLQLKVMKLVLHLHYQYLSDFTHSQWQQTD